MQFVSAHVMRTIALTAIALSAATSVSPCVATASAQSANGTRDREAVRQAVLDYVEGVYQAQPERIHRSVSPELAKLGLFRAANDTTGQYRPGTMSFARLVEVAATYSKNTKVPANAPRKIDIYDVLDRTASVKLTALWGSDYMLLAKQPDGRWLITHVLWQSPPR